MKRSRRPAPVAIPHAPQTHSASVAPWALSTSRRTPQPLEVARNPDALLRLSTASALLGLSVATIYRKSAVDPDFPKLIKIGSRCTRMRAGDATAWAAQQHTSAEV